MHDESAFELTPAAEGAEEPETRVLGGRSTSTPKAPKGKKAVHRSAAQGLTDADPPSAPLLLDDDFDQISFGELAVCTLPNVLA